MTGERTEGAALSGTLDVTIGGRPRTLPVLKLRQSKEWKERLGSVVASLSVDIDGDLAGAIARVAALPADVAVDLLVAYDRSGVLGGADRIEDEATDAEVIDAVLRLVKVTFPFEMGARSVAEAFGPQLRDLVMAVLTDTARRLARGSSTPTRSATGDSTPTHSNGGTPTSSFSSSGPMTSAPSATDGGMSAT